MLFSRHAILTALAKGLLVIDPFVESDVEDAHINLHLEIPTDTLVVPAKGFVLVSTQETITFHGGLCGMIEGRASLAKQGISIEQSSTFLEPTTSNKITLEIFNASDRVVKLKQGQEIAKLLVVKTVDTI